MSNKLDQGTRKPARVRGLLVTALALGCTFGTVRFAAAQTVTAPATPTAITAPEGNSAFLVGHAFGSQGYICLPASTGGTSWTVNPARPEATLFTDIFGQPFQIITHFLSIDASPNENAPNPVSLGGNATWQSSLDTSRVWAVVFTKLGGGSIVAGTDPSCPNSGSIPCLLLQAVGSQQGPTGGTILSNTTFVQRLNTNGGAAPADGCFTSADVGKQALVPYTADYYFFHKSN